MERDPEIPFTYKYSQPEEYHFSIDSIEMAWRVSKHLLSNDHTSPMAEWNCLDLCAGCGVIGLELNFHVEQLKKWDFVEVQSVYQSHFENNRELALARNQSLRPRLSLVRENLQSSGQPQLEFLNLNYDRLLEDPRFHHKYQLIVCNPPYFLPSQGKLSPSEFKNRCRFFLDSSFERLIESIYQSLAMDGEAFLLLRDLEDHQIDLLGELRRLIKGRLECESLGLIRGTILLKLCR